MRHDLIDEYLLFVHPVVLGSGRRMFGDGSPPASLRLVDIITTTKGVLIARYGTGAIGTHETQTS
jgi:dihydrofolate reductase